MPIKININADDVVGLTRKLERMRRSQVPRVMGSTLNRLAFESKKRLPEEFKKKGFENRRKNFYRFVSRFEKVKTFNVSKMTSSVGVANVTTSDAAKNMEQQEKGGSIEKTFTPSEQARISGSNSRQVKTKNRLSKGFKIPKRGSKFNVKKGNKKEFISKGSALAKKGGGILVYGKHVFRVNRILKRKHKPLKTEFIYTKNPTKKIKVKGNFVVSDTGVKVGRNFAKYYIESAKRFIK